MRMSILLQHLLPHKLLSSIVRRATRWTFAPWKNLLIGTVVRRYAVDLAEAESASYDDYAHFNAFFTRALKPGARPMPADAAAVACPADGHVSRSGTITDGRLLQAKGIEFSAAELLGDAAAAQAYAGGDFVTIYLSPRDYHRVHMPLDGELVETLHVPGRLFGVAPFVVAAVPRLFARNERLVCHFRHARGPFAVVLVGAMLVSGIETVWNGIEVPPYAKRPLRRDYRGRGIRLARGDELGRFDMGSTVIVLLPAALARIDPALRDEQAVRVGDAIGRVRGQTVTEFEEP
ncbi:MAG TPA: archaetidylserine decarboxylase [Dokdonella sp.]